MAQAKRKRAETPLLEWIAAFVGLGLLLALLAVIANETISGEAEQLPAISVVHDRPLRTESGYVVRFEARNASGGTAAAVAIEGVLKSGDTVVETSGATLDYVPGHASVKGGLFFTKDPSAHALEVRATGFQTP